MKALFSYVFSTMAGLCLIVGQQAEKTYYRRDSPERCIAVRRSRRNCCYDKKRGGLL